MNIPKRRARITTAVAILALATVPASAGVSSVIYVAHAATGQPFMLTMTNAGTTVPGATASGSADTQATEVDSALSDGDTGAGGDGGVNRTIVTAPANGPTVKSGQKAKSNPELTQSFDGLNFFQQRTANGGNQFSVEPPDQGLCAGNGFVLESANDVLRIFMTGGGAATGVIDLNTFYGDAPAINRGVSPLQFGPEITDPSCYFDTATKRWFHLVLTLDRAIPTSQALSGANHLDLAVSTTSNPLGSWTIYHLPVQDDGTQGTPDHHCVARSGSRLVHGPCLGDYPHIGADANGIYLTTNEFNLAAPGFRGSQVYAISKQALESGTASIPVFGFDTAGDPSLQINALPGFTVWPATSPSAADFNADNGSTEFFLSSTAVFQDNGLDNHLEVWSLTNTQSLNSANPDPNLSVKQISTEDYGVPPSSQQKAGDTPLASCIADPTCAPRVGAAFAHTNAEANLPSNDSRMQQVVWTNGKLWGALDTGLAFTSDPTHILAGIAYFIVRPVSNGAGTVSAQGYLGLQGENLTYPALGVTSSGRGVMAFTVVGPDFYPSSGYAGLDAIVGAGDIHMAATGLGPQDGFTAYFPLVNPIRPRWGDYGAAVADGNAVWLASEYIGQTCNLAQYESIPFGTCGGTRASLGNWDTRITEVTP